MSDDESLILEDLNSLASGGETGLPQFTRARIYDPEKYGLEGDGRLHVLAEYHGDEREDGVFSALMAENMKFRGQAVDWNPISIERTGTIEQYLEHLGGIQKEAEEKTMDEKTGRRVKSAEDFMKIYNSLREAEESAAWRMTEQAARAALGAFGDSAVLAKDGKFAAVSSGQEPEEADWLTKEDFVRAAERKYERWSEDGELSEGETANLAVIKWFRGGFSFPMYETLEAYASEDNFKKLEEHFPEITREQADIISNAMPNVSVNVYANKLGVFVEDVTDGEPDLNNVDLPTLAEYALGDTSLSTEEQDILWSLVPNVSHGKAEEKTMEEKASRRGTIRLDDETKEFYRSAGDQAEADRLEQKAYRAYQYEWLNNNGISLDDIAEKIDDAMRQYRYDTAGEEISASEAMGQVIDECGIDGTMFASFEEFKDNELRNEEAARHYMDRDFKRYAELTGMGSAGKAADVYRQNAEDYIRKMGPDEQESARDALRSIKAQPLDVYFASGDDAKMNAYLVSRTDSGSYTTHLINENGLNWGHYDIATKWAAQKQAMTRAAGTDLGSINLIEVERDERRAPENSRDEVIAQVTWTRQDIVNAIENEKGPGYEVTDKDIESALDELSPKYMEEKMIETGWDFISEAVTSSLSQDKSIPLHDVFVADKERKVAMSFHPEYVFNEKTGEDDLPNVGITVENTISGLRSSMDKVIPAPYLSEFQQENGGGFFVRNIAAKEGITSEKIEGISADEFQKIHEKRELMPSPEKQPPVERLLRQTQAVLFRKGIEGRAGDTDEIFRSAQSILKTFTKEEKEAARTFFKNFGDIERTKSANEVTALAHFIASSDPAEVMKKYPSPGKETKNTGKENSEQALFDIYEDIAVNSTDSLEAFGWMDKSVKQPFAEDLFQKLGTALNMRTDIDHEKLLALQKAEDDRVSFSESEDAADKAPDEKELEGLYKAARAVEVAVAGKHSLILEGKDSKGRDALAERLARYLTPDITAEERESVERIYSLAGLQSPAPSVPIRKPVPDSQLDRMLGGGPRLMPGEAELAHNGILLVKGVEQFRSTTLHALRLLLMSGTVTLARAGRETVYPCRAQLMLTMRPSPDGNFGSRSMVTIDTPGAVERFREKVAEPLLGRIEVREYFEKDTRDKKIFVPSEARKHVRRAYEIQRRRGIFNRDLDDAGISRYCKLGKECADFLKETAGKSGLSRREAASMLRVSLTIANMDGREQIQLMDLTEAYNLSLPATEKYRAFPSPVATPEMRRHLMDSRREERMCMDLAGLCVARHLADKSGDDGRMREAADNSADYLSKHAREIRKAGADKICAAVKDRLALQDFDTDLIGSNISAADERGFVAEALREDIDNIPRKAGRKRGEEISR